MKFKFYCFFIFFLVIVFRNISAEETPVSSSENVGSDSLLSLPPQEIIADSSEKISENLKADIDKLVHSESANELFLSLPIYRENYHLQSAFPLNLYFRKNGFSIFPFRISEVHLLQNYLPFYQMKYTENSLDFTKINYDFPVAFSRTNLGLGDNEMNHAFLSFRKGNILGIKKLHLDFDVLTYDGLWLSEREKATNFNLKLLYDTNLGEFYFFVSSIDENISDYVLSEADSVHSAISEKSSDFTFLFANKIADIGVRHEKNKVGNDERETWQILLKKEIRLKNYRFGISLERFLQPVFSDSAFTILGFRQDSQIAGFDWENRIDYLNREKYEAASILQKAIFSHFFLQGKYSVYSFSNTLERKGLGWIFKSDLFQNETSFGLQKNSDKNGFYVETRNTANLPINKISIKLQNRLFFRQAGNDDFFPKWQSKNLFEITGLLKYENSISLGIKHIFCSEIETESPTNNIDIYLKIGITPKFEIKGEIVNILNREELFGNPLPPTHFIANVKWIFIN